MTIVYAILVQYMPELSLSAVIQREMLPVGQERALKTAPGDPQAVGEDVATATVTQVASIGELEDAIATGAAHIEIIDHLDFTTSSSQSVLNLLPYTHSIRV